MINLLSAVPPPTTVPITSGTGGGRDWFDYTQYLGVQVAAVAGVVALVAAFIALRRTRSDCAFGRPVALVAGDNRIVIRIPVHVVPGGSSFVCKKYEMSFKRNGVEIDNVVPRADMPLRSDREYRGELQYEMDDGDPVDVLIRVKFKDGAKAKVSARLESPFT